jgi:hypothetical protein
MSMVICLLILSNILNKWKNYFFSDIECALYSDVRQTEIHAAELFTPGPSSLEDEIAIAKLKKYKSPGSGNILAEIIQAGGETLLSVVNKLINSLCERIV